MNESDSGEVLAFPMSESAELALAATGAAAAQQAPVPRPPPFNTRIGTILLEKYRIDALIGAGGCGRVYRATHTRLQGTVAVKFLLADWSRHAVLRARFEREARLLARLSHPGVVAAHDYGEDAGELYLVMEYVTGRPLGLVMNEQPAGLPISRVVAIMAQAQEALAAAHSCGIIHRDIKPSNIMLYEDDAGIERIKLLDFGVALVVPKGTEHLPRLTLRGQVIGTLNYMAPEQCRGQSVGPPADIYSLGVVFYQMLTGRLPFSARSHSEIMNQHIHGTPAPIERFAMHREVPAELAELALWALEKSPTKRPTAMQFRQALRCFGEAGGRETASSSLLAPTPLYDFAASHAEPSPRGDAQARVTLEAVIIQAGDSVTLPVVALWGLPADRLEDLRIGLAMHSARGLPWLSDQMPPLHQDNQIIRAIVLSDGPHTTERLRALREGPHRKTPVLVLEVTDPEHVVDLIHAGASDMALASADRERLCHQTLRLIRRQR